MPSVYSRSKHLLQTMTWHHHHRIVNVSSSLMQQRCIESGLNICVLQFNYCIPRSSCQIIYDNSPCCSCALAPRASISLLRDAGRRSWLSPRVQQIPVHFTHHTLGRDVAEQNAWENMQVETKISSSNTLTETKARMSLHMSTAAAVTTAVHRLTSARAVVQFLWPRSSFFIGRGNSCTAC